MDEEKYLKKVRELTNRSPYYLTSENGSLRDPKRKVKNPNAI